MALTIEEQKKVVEAENNLKDYLVENPHMQEYQDSIDKKLEAIRTPVEILKPIAKSIKKPRKKAAPKTK